MARSRLFGTAVAPGIAIGKIVSTHNEVAVEERFVTQEQVPKEIEKLRAAAKDVSEVLQLSKVNSQLAEHSAIIQSHIMMSKDPRLLDDAEEFIRSQRLCASWALEKAIDALCAAFLDIDDPYLQDRALDLRAVGLRLQCRLAGKEYVPLADEVPCVHMAEDLSPVDTFDLPVQKILALVMAEGGVASHTTILARALKIPTIVGVTGILDIAKDGELVIVDALSGCVYIDPNEEELEEFYERQLEYAAWEAGVQSTAHLAAQTRDAVRIEVQANIDNNLELDDLTEYGAEGVGLYRTEFAYMRARKLPTQEQLFLEYKHVAEKIHPQPVVFRVLDVGADKMLDRQSPLKETNPALGLRGIRYCLRHQSILRTQLRALLRAGVTGNVSIMLPMISNLEEVRAVKNIMREVHQDLCIQGVEHVEYLPLGCMIEVPAAVVLAGALARECDFLSIGTNDLVHYLLAIDRGNKHVAYLHQPLHPVVSQSIKSIIDSAHREGIGVSVCGEMVTDPYCLAMLVGFGVDSVSASPKYIPAVKHLIRQLNAEKCRNMAQTVLTTYESTACARIVSKTLDLDHDYSFYTSMISTQG